MLNDLLDVNHTAKLHQFIYKSKSETTQKLSETIQSKKTFISLTYGRKYSHSKSKINKNLFCAFLA